MGCKHGPPCQTFSAAGRRANVVLGTTDARGVLFREYVRLLKELRPKGFLFEEWARFQSGNVPKDGKSALAHEWLVAVAESFGRKRLDVAPIDEPCETWLKDLTAWLESLS